MALDFPASPSVGQVFTSGNQSWLWDGTKWTALGSVQNVYKPNKLINPFCEIDQRNEGAANVNVATTPYLVDGITVGSASIGVISGQRVVNAPTGYSNSVMLTVTTPAAVVAGTALFLIRRVEADDIIDTGFGTANAQAISAAVWLRASVAGVYSLAVRNTANNRSYVTTVNIGASNIWQLFSLVIPGDTGGTWVTSGNGVGLELDVCPCAGTTFQTSLLNTWQTGNFIAANTALNSFSNTAGATFQMGPGGLWVSPSPQPLLRTSIMAELARCQRYLEKSYDLGTALGTATQNGSSVITAGSTPVTTQTTIYYKVTKRVPPTGTFYSPVTGAPGHARDYQNNVDLVLTVGSNGDSAVSWFALPTAGAPNLAVQWMVDASL